MNDFLTGLFAGGRLILVSYTLKLGRYIVQEEDDFRVMIGDEITPRTCELWDGSGTGSEENRQKHRYLSDIEVANRLGLLPKYTSEEQKNEPVSLNEFSAVNRAHFS